MLVNTVKLHEYGITGKNVKVGLIDAGVYTPHPVFEKARIIKEYDFVNNIPSVIAKDHKLGRDHGTNVLSVIGGYKEHKLIGIASMHKSNLVPVFQGSEAIEVSQMRRS